MRLYFIRHGQSINNVLWQTTQSRAAYTPDPDLSELGFLQAELLAAHLASMNDVPESDGHGITHLYTSPMTRAIQTALPISKSSKLELQVWPDWFEDGGFTQRNPAGEHVGLPGRDRAYFQNRFPEVCLPEHWAENGWWQSKPRETSEQTMARARQVWQELLDRHGYETDRVAIVSHGWFHRWFMGVVLGIPQPDQFALDCFNTGITRVNVRENDWQVFVPYTNRTLHLPLELITT